MYYHKKNYFYISVNQHYIFSQNYTNLHILTTHHNPLHTLYYYLFINVILQWIYLVNIVTITVLLFIHNLIVV